MKDAQLEDGEILRLSVYDNGVQLVSDSEVYDDELEELLDEDSTCFGNKELVTLGFGIGSYLATNKRINKVDALALLLASIKKSITAVENDKSVRVVEKHEDRVEDKKEISFDETEYK